MDSVLPSFSAVSSSWVTGDFKSVFWPPSGADLVIAELAPLTLSSESGRHQYCALILEQLSLRVLFVAGPAPWAATPSTPSFIFALIFSLCSACFSLATAAQPRKACTKPNGALPSGVSVRLGIIVGPTLTMPSSTMNQIALQPSLSLMKLQLPSRMVLSGRAA
jgi:hypothetical protein